MQNKILKVGAAETVITPRQKDVFLLGPVKPSEGIHGRDVCPGVRGQHQW